MVVTGILRFCDPGNHPSGPDVAIGLLRPTRPDIDGYDRSEQLHIRDLFGLAPRRDCLVSRQYTDFLSVSIRVPTRLCDSYPHLSVDGNYPLRCSSELGLSSKPQKRKTGLKFRSQKRKNVFAFLLTQLFVVLRFCGPAATQSTYAIFLFEVAEKLQHSAATSDYTDYLLIKYAKKIAQIGTQSV